jgi:hypothetical protein
MVLIPVLETVLLRHKFDSHFLEKVREAKVNEIDMDSLASFIKIYPKKSELDNLKE